MLVTMVHRGSVERVEVPDESIIVFPTGILGFEDLRRFALFEAGEQLHFLQCVDDPYIGFILLSPFLVEPNYRAVLAESDRRLLEAAPGDTPKLFCIVSLPTSGNEASMNLRAPLAISLASQRAVQIVLAESSYPVRYSLEFTDEGDLLVPTPSAEATGKGIQSK